MKIELPQLPPISIHKSKRSRRLCLKVCPARGLRLMAPPRASIKHMMQFIEQHRPWIEKHWASITQHATLFETHQDRLDLTALGESWSIQYCKAEAVGISFTIQESSLVLQGAIDNLNLMQLTLRTWLQDYAKHTLLPWLERLSQESGLTYRKASVRYAHTRWGSCSSRQQIMLNVKLLFLPKEWVEYVMWHELCHTVHMNHGLAFWHLLHQYCPNSITLRQQLRQAHRYIPRWLQL